MHAFMYLCTYMYDIKKFSKSNGFNNDNDKIEVKIFMMYQ